MSLHQLTRRILVTITQSEIARYFRIGDEMMTGGGRAQFRVLDINNESVAIQPLMGKTRHRLPYQKLDIVAKYFREIRPGNIEHGLTDVLKRFGLDETTTEVYLYGFAREYRNRKSALKALSAK